MEFLEEQILAHTNQSIISEDETGRVCMRMVKDSKINDVQCYMSQVARIGSDLCGCSHRISMTFSLFLSRLRTQNLSI